MSRSRRETRSETKDVAIRDTIWAKGTGSAIHAPSVAVEHDFCFVDRRVGRRMGRAAPEQQLDPIYRVLATRRPQAWNVEALAQWVPGLLTARFLLSSGSQPLLPQAATAVNCTTDRQQRCRASIAGLKATTVSKSYLLCGSPPTAHVRLLPDPTPGHVYPPRAMLQGVKLGRHRLQ